MRRRFARSVLTLAAISLAVFPASALGETAEPAPTTETPPASTGWVPQGGASEGTGSGSSGAQQGSSLGSGSSPSTPAPKPPPPSPPPVSTAPAPAPEPSTSYEAEAPAEATAPEPAPAPEPEPAPAKPEPKPSPPVDAHVALGSADAVLVGSGDVKGVSASSASAASTTAPITPESGGLPWLALIVFGLILVVAGARLVFGPIEADSLRYSRFKFLRRAAPRG
jgi:outer membrane biosynthesis protein TonB